MPLIADRIFRVGCWAAVVAVAIQSISHLADVAIWDGDVFALNADVEGNALAWASSSATLAAALMALLPAIASSTVDRSGLVLAGILAYFSFDDAVGIHERISETSVEALGARISLERLVWPAVYLPLLGVAFLLLWRIAERGPRPVTRGIRIGLALLVAAVVAEITSVLYLPEGSENTWKDAIEVVIEEGAELAAWILIAAALAVRAYLLAREEARA